MSFLRPIVLLLALSLAAQPVRGQTMTGQGAAQADQPSAVVFVYHRVGDDSDPANNIREDQFRGHVEELEHGGYTVLPLAYIVEALKSGRPLPDRSVAITFDGGHKSVLETAAPLLLSRNMPFTVFIAPGLADGGLGDYLTWNDIRRLNRNKLVTIGLHSAAYMHLADLSDSEILRQINTAKARFRDELGQQPALFAYPFGEYSLRIRSLVERNGFRAAFGQQSGVSYAGSDMFALPRFSMTESYGDLDRFRMAADALPFPVTGVQPADPHLATAQPLIGFTVAKSLEKKLSSLSCYVSDQEAPSIETVGENRVEIRPRHNLDSDRVRVNCTLPVSPAGPDDPVRWRWFGLLLTNPSTVPYIAGGMDDPPAGG